VATRSPRRERVLPDYYALLEVSQQASQEVIQAAYRALARSFHPDVNHAADAADVMRRLNAAYDVLGDPERRAAYDARRARVSRLRAVPTSPGRGAPHGPRIVARAQWTQPQPQVRRQSVAPLGRVLVAGVVAVTLLFTIILGVWAVNLGDEPTLIRIETVVDDPGAASLFEGSAGPVVEQRPVGQALESRLALPENRAGRP
jgi:hypothetical protein